MNTPAPEISLIGWLHFAACVTALIAGAAQIVAPKGTSIHLTRGNVYFISMVIANLTPLFLFRADLIIEPGRGPVIGPFFGVFHWLAMITLAIVVLGFIAAKRQARAWGAYMHPVCMILSYWLLVGGAINEGFARLEWLQEMALAISPGATGIQDYRLLLWCQYANNLLALVALIMAVREVRRFRRNMPAQVSVQFS